MPSKRLKNADLMRYCRDRRGQTQSELARDLGVSLRRVQYIEQGQKDLKPPLELAVRWLLHEVTTKRRKP